MSPKRVFEAMRPASDMASRRRVLLLVVCLLVAAGCRNDMHDQAKYEPLEPSTFFKDGTASRQPVEGTVPRMPAPSGAGLYLGNYPGGQPGAVPGGVGDVTGSTPPGGTSGTAVQGQQPEEARAPRPGVGAGLGATGQVIPPPAAPGGQSPAAQDNTFPFQVTAEVLNRGEERFNIACSICHGRVGIGDGMIVRRGYRQPPSLHLERLRAAPVSHYYDVITNGFGAMPSYADMLKPGDRYAIIAYIRALQLSQNATQADVPPAEWQRLNAGGQPK